MPPLQPSSAFDPTTAIPFDHSPDDNSALFPSSKPEDAFPSELDIATLFGVAPFPAPTQRHPLAPSLNPPAPLAPPAQYSSHQLNVLPQGRAIAPITPIPASSTFTQPAPPSAASLPRKKPTHHRYPSYSQSTPYYPSQDQVPFQHQLQSQPQSSQDLTQQHTPSYNTNSPNYNDPASQYNVNGYSVYSGDFSGDYQYSVNESTENPNRFMTQTYGAPTTTDNSTTRQGRPSANPLMLNTPSRSIFSRLAGSSDGGSIGGGGGAGPVSAAPKLAKVAASYVSSTLAVTSTFASEKLATASTKIADLWQNNSNAVLPQQQQQQHQYQPQQQQHYYNHDNHYSQEAAGNTSINSQFVHGSTDTNMAPTDMRPAFGAELNSASHCNSSFQSTNPNYGHSRTDAPFPYEHSPPSTQQQQPLSALTGATGSFAVAASSTLSNAASVAGSYLPKLSKLPALPWGRDKGLQLPQQQHQDSFQQHVQQYSSPQQQSYRSYQPPLDHAQYHQEESVYSTGQQEGLLAGTGAWWGGLRNEVQKGRRMVESGVQAGVAWWLDSDAKNPLRGVV